MEATGMIKAAERAKVKEYAEVLAADRLAEEICSLVLRVGFAGRVGAGQFVSLFSQDGAKLLPRPISVCGADPVKGEIRLVFRIAGAGTREMASLRPGSRIGVMGPLGNGFPLEKLAGKKVLLLGGGIGIPPMLMLGRALKETGNTEVVCAAGYRTADTYLLEELRETGRVLVSTDDGSLGVKGTVLDAVRADGLIPEVICACGPKPMLKAVKEYAAQLGAPAWISLEERMACGVGVCLGCVTKTVGQDAHSMVHNARVCTDGPVFAAEEVAL